MFAYVRLMGKKMLRALRAATRGGSEPPNCRFQISDCKSGNTEQLIADCKMHDRWITADQD